MKITNIIYGFVSMLSMLGIAQEHKEKQNNNKHFSIKINGGYSTTIAQSKILIVGGEFNLKNAPTMGGTFAWYYNKNWSLSLATSTGKYNLSMENGYYPNMEMYRYQMDLGSVWITPLQLAAQYHLTSISKNIIPYTLLGGSYVLFNNVDPGWGADQINYKNVGGIVFGIGTDYYIKDQWFINAEAKALFTDRSNVDLDFTKSMDWQIKAQLQPHQINFNLGVGYKF